MKKLILLSALAAFVHLNLSAQDDKKAPSSPLQIGFKAGINIATLKATAQGESDASDPLLGFHGGLFLTAPLGRSFAIQPELAYSVLGGKDEMSGTELKLPLSYLNLPVLLKYYVPNSQLSIYAGPQLGILLSAKAKAEGVSEDIKEAFKETDFAGVFGMDYTFNKFNIAARYQLGFSNILEGTTGDEKLKNNAFTFTLGYRIR